MSEVEKMYENARVYDFRYDCDVSFSDGDFGRITNCSKGEIKDYCTDKKYFKGAKVINVRHLYPPFTAEKQLELIKFLSNFWVHINKVNEQFNISTGGGYVSYYAEDLADAIALYINSKWNNLTEQERTEVRSILE